MSRRARGPCVKDGQSGTPGVFPERSGVTSKSGGACGCDPAAGPWPEHRFGVRGLGQAPNRRAWAGLSSLKPGFLSVKWCHTPTPITKVQVHDALAPDLPGGSGSGKEAVSLREGPLD